MRRSQQAESRDERRTAVDIGADTPPASQPRGIGLQRAAVLDLGAMITVVVLILVGMEITSRFVPDYIMPSPVAVFEAVWRLAIANHSDILVTLGRLAAAMAVSMVVGILLGLVMGSSATARPFIRSLVIIDTGIPALSWILLAVFWFKNPEIRIFFILVMILVPFFALNVYDGIRALPKDFLDMIESFRPSQWQTLRYLIIPHIVPYILMTTKSVIGYATRMVIFAELVASAVGIGSQMGLAQATFHIEEVFAWTFFLVVLNIVLQLLVTGVRTGDTQMAARSLDAMMHANFAHSAEIAADDVIALRGVRKDFGNYPAVDNLSFHVRKGEIVILLGRTGAGKTTVLNLVMGTTEPSQGEIRVAGLDPFRQFDQLRGHLAVSFQTDRLLPWRTAVENVELGLLILRKSKSVARKTALAWLARVNLAGAENKYVHELSGGMRQRVRSRARSRSIQTSSCSTNCSASSIKSPRRRSGVTLPNSPDSSARPA